MSIYIKRQARLFVILVIQIVFLYTPLPVHGQTTQQDSIYVCVSPLPPETALKQKSFEPRPLKPYLLIFRNTHLFGLIIPHTANVVVYGSSGLGVGLYTIDSDAPTGGYRIATDLGEFVVQSGVIDPLKSESCVNSYKDILPANLPSTIPLRVSPERVVNIQDNGKNLLSSPSLGAFSFIFETVDKADFPFPQNVRPGFQIIQLERGTIDIKLSFMPRDTAFSLIANKNFSVEQNRIKSDSLFSSEKRPDEFNFLIDGYQSPNEFFKMLENAKVRIYPSYGFSSQGSNPKLTYLGGFIRIELSGFKAQRKFAPGSFVKPITGATARYYLPDTLTHALDISRALDALTNGNSAQVIRVDEQTGQLIVKVKAQDGKEKEVIIESWLVDQIPNSEPKPTSDPD